MKKKKDQIRTRPEDKSPEILELSVQEVEDFVLRGQLIDKKNAEVHVLKEEISLLQGEFATYVETLLKRHGKAPASQWRFDGKRLIYVTGNNQNRG